MCVYVCVHITVGVVLTSRPPVCRRSGVVYVADREAGFGLAAQEPWIQHASVRDNILFGRDYDPVFFQAVTEACALLDDLNVRSLRSVCSSPSGSL